MSKEEKTQDKVELSRCQTCGEKAEELEIGLQRLKISLRDILNERKNRNLLHLNHVENVNKPKIVVF